MSLRFFWRGLLMSIFLNISVLALRQVAEGAANAVGLNATGKAVIGFLGDHFTDHSQRLTNALQNANDRAWKAFEVALAGESLLERCKVALAHGEDKAFREQVRAFLDISPLTKASAEHAQLFKQALQELRSVRSGGMLKAGSLTPSELAREAGSLAHFNDPQALLDAEWRLVDQAAGELRERSPNLWKLLVARPKAANKPSLLAVAVRYYFRREVESDQALSQGLSFAKLEALTEAQKKGFDSLSAALAQQGQRLEGLLDSVIVAVTGIDVTTRDTNARVRGLEEQLQKLFDRFQLQGRELRPGDSMSVRSEGDQQHVVQLVGEYRALPEEQRRQRPDLLNRMGVLRAAAGELEEAQKDFQEAAKLTADPKVKAEAHFNAYRAALERRAWDEALAVLRQAVALDPGRFAPFPFSKYEPQRILGAGGFGVVFLCRPRHLNKPLVVKSLTLSELDRDVAQVFVEAQALDELDHPAIIRLRDCDYADAKESRPFVVMDYFDGASLEAYVDAQALSPEDLLAVAVPTAQALKAAHDKGILHRDVKPANLLVRCDGGVWQVKLIDFGLALRPTALQSKTSTDEPRAQTTTGKSIAGTLHYAAPEQMGQGGEVGPHSDVYGFGKTCYFALFGTPEPDDVEKESLPKPWRRFLSQCTGRKLENRLADFTAALAELTAIKTQTVVVVKKGVEPPRQVCSLKRRISWRKTLAGKWSRAQATPVASCPRRGWNGCRPSRPGATHAHGFMLPSPGESIGCFLAWK